MIFVLIFLWTIVAILIVTNPKNRTIRWGSAIAFFSGFGALAVLLRDNVNLQNNQYFSHYIILAYNFTFTLSHHMPPYVLLVFSIIYSGFLENYKCFLKVTPYVLFIPIVIMYYVFPFIPEYKPSFLILSVWVVPYILFANFLLVYSTLKEKNKSIRQQRILTSILITPNTLFAMVVNYILKIFGINDFWRFNIITISVTFIIFVIFSIRYGVMGVRLRFEKLRLDNTIRIITSGTAMLNHTIKNEIFKIGMCTNNVKMSVNNSVQDLNDINDNISLIIDSTEFISEMIKRIQLQSQEIVLIEEVNNFKDILSNALEMSILYMKDKEIKVLNYCDNDIFFKCDSIHVQEVLHNVFKNAIESMTTGGELKINMIESKNNISISIADTGCGISKENISHVFDPFFSTKRNTTNFGLGLSYCYNVMQLHGGTLEIESEKDLGTIVLLIFPKVKSIKFTDFLFRRSFING